MIDARGDLKKKGDHRIRDKGAVMAEAQVKRRGLSFEIRPGRTPSVAVLKAPDCDVRRRCMQKLCQTPAGEPAHRHRGIMIAAFFRRGKTPDIPEYMLQDV